jgi:outer membrane lipoprotein LolB
VIGARLVRAEAAVVAAAVLLAGCASMPPAGDVLAGRIALKIDAVANEPARQFNASFELRGNADAGELDLTHPLGTVVARARWAPGRAELVTPDGSTGFTDLTDLAARTFGEPLPLAAVLDWLRGRPWPGAPHRAAADARGFEQLGWQVDLAQFARGTVVARRASPAEVTLRALLERAP